MAADAAPENPAASIKAMAERVKAAPSLKAGAQILVEQGLHEVDALEEAALIRGTHPGCRVGPSDEYVKAVAARITEFERRLVDAPDLEAAVQILVDRGIPYRTALEDASIARGADPGCRTAR